MKRFEYTPEQYIDSVKEKIKSIVADKLGFVLEEAEEINDDSKLVSDLGADELDIIEIVIEVEKEFNISCPDEELWKIWDDEYFTFGNFVNLIKEINAVSLQSN